MRFAIWGDPRLGAALERHSPIYLDSLDQGPLDQCEVLLVMTPNRLVRRPDGPRHVVSLGRRPSPVAGVLSLVAEGPGPELDALLVALLGSETDQAQDLLARVGHEIRSPMAIIAMACQLARSPDLDTEQRIAHLGYIEEASKVIQTLINDILDFSKLDQNRVTLTEVPFDLHSLVESVAHSHALLVINKNLEVSQRVDPQVPRQVLGDPGRLRQILTNLTSNAVKFTSQGEVCIEVERQGEALRFSVRDTGIGIEPEAQEKIFAPYVQANKSILAEFGGTGLGLSITRMLVEKMGGRIGVTSEPGQGSTFSFAIELAGVEETVLVASRRSLAQTRLLLVGRSFPAQWLAALEGWGVNYRQVWRKEQIRRNLSEGWEVVMFDLEMGGFPFLEGLVKTCQPEKLVVTTAAGQRGDAGRCEQMGGKAYLTRPLSERELQTALQLVLDARLPGLITRHTLRELAQPSLAS